MKVSRAIIGGFGLSELINFKILDTFYTKTPYGYPSNVIQIGEYNGYPLAFLSRFSKQGIRNIYNKANIYSLKLLGIQKIISLDMVGILDKNIELMDIILPDQIVDLTRFKNKDQSFFENLPMLINFSNPICQNLYNFLSFILKVKCKKNFFSKKIYYGIDGTFFPTISESLLYQSWGGAIIGVDIVSEMKLAKQAEICYTFLAFASDYDACFFDKKKTSIEIFSIIQKNIEMFYNILNAILKNWEILKLSCSCHDAMKNILSNKTKKLPKHIQKNIRGIYEKYFI